MILGIINVYRNKAEFMETIWDLFSIVIPLYIGYQFIFNRKKLTKKSYKNWEKWFPLHNFSELEIEIWEYLYLIGGFIFVVLAFRSLFKFLNIF